ncbi:MAG: hypothetical protein Kilf2KO_44680 [Rhodospirillales bacterium]
MSASRPASDIVFWYELDHELPVQPQVVIPFQGRAEITLDPIGGGWRVTAVEASSTRYVERRRGAIAYREYLLEPLDLTKGLAVEILAAIDRMLHQPGHAETVQEAYERELAACDLLDPAEIDVREARSAYLGGLL